MNDGDAVRRPCLDAATSSPFDDHNNGFGNPPRIHRRANSFDERSGCSWSIPPPASRPRPDHVRRIDEKHYSSITDPVQGHPSKFRRSFNVRRKVASLSNATLTWLDVLPMLG